MGIKSDTLEIKEKQEEFFVANGRYLQILKTPEQIPSIGEKTSFTELRVPDHEVVTVNFTPTAKDFQFFVYVVSGSRKDAPTQHGYYIHARRLQGDNVLEEFVIRQGIIGE